MKKTLPAFALSLFLPFAAQAEDISYTQVVLRGLDKITGRLSTMTVNVGEKTTFGALDVYARVCYAHPPEETPENAAFLEIVENKEDGQLKLFSGWMFSSSPALSAMDHAVYDVWVMKCQGEQAAPPVPEPLVLDRPLEYKPVAPKLKITWDEESQTVTDLPELQPDEEKPVDPENAESAETAAPENEPVVIRVEQNRTDEENAEPREFKLTPISEPAETPADESVVSAETSEAAGEHADQNGDEPAAPVEESVEQPLVQEQNEPAASEESAANEERTANDDGASVEEEAFDEDAAD